MDPATLKLLGLDEDATDEQIATAVTELADKANTPAPETEPTKTLEDMASESGMVLLDEEAVKTLQTQAAAGEAAAKLLSAERFDRAFTAAVEEGRKTPAERETLEHFYELDSDGVLKMLADAPVIAGTTPKGHGGDDGIEAPDKLHGPSYRLDIAVKKLLETDPNLDPETDYMVALDRVQKNPKILEEVAA